MSPNKKPLLQACGLTKRFGSFIAVKNVSFEVPVGCVFGIAGPNGAGKSTLFSTISGFNKPTSGAILFAERNIAGLSPYRVARMGLVRTFQTPTLFHSMTVEENLRIGGDFGNKEKGDLVPDILEKLELTHVANSTAANLDLFTTKKIVLASSLATNPRLLLLDEPMAGFSQQEVIDYCQLIDRIRTEHGVTIVIIEHLLDVLIDISDRMLILHYGEVLFEGEPEDIHNNADVAEVYLGKATLQENI